MTQSTAARGAVAVHERVGRKSDVRRKEPTAMAQPARVGDALGADRAAGVRRVCCPRLVDLVVAADGAALRPPDPPVGRDGLLMVADSWRGSPRAVFGLLDPALAVRTGPPDLAPAGVGRAVERLAITRPP
ncbi:MAG: hypothetical protein ACYCVN_13785 [Acidimicrobiales bacterium]